MRKLASIQRIEEMNPIEGRDQIVLARVLGWQVIVRKADYNVGDLCCYIEIDSVLPEKPEFEFLRPKKFHIKTMKMAGVRSEGICFPLSILPKRDKPYEIGEDVTDIIGVKQYEPTQDKESADLLSAQAAAKHYPKFLMRFPWFRRLVLPKKASGKFPDFFSKSDEIRIQNIPYVLKDKSEFVSSEKLDGMSSSYALVRHKGLFRDKFEFIVCSRNLRLPHPDASPYWYIAQKYQIENALKNMIGDREWIAIQGEIIGPKIQKNKYKRDDYELYVFNLIYPTGRLGSVKAKSIIENKGLNFVPLIDTAYVLPDTVDEVLAYAHGNSVLGDTLREGIVFRSQDGQRSFKAVDPEFLLKYSE